MFDRALTFFRQFNSELWILAVGWFVGALGFAASIPFIGVYFHKEFGMSTIDIGLFFGGLAVVRSVFQIVGGEMFDRLGHRALLVHSQIFRSIAFLAMGLAIAFDWGFWWIAGFLFINSVFGAVFMPAVNAMVSTILPANKRLDGFAISRSAGNLGWAIGPAMGGALAAASYAVLFYISAVITLASGLIFWWFLKVPDSKSVAERFRFKDLAEIRHDKYLAVHSFLILALYLVVSQLILPFSVYGVEFVGLSEGSLGWLYFVNGVIVVACQIPVTRLLAKKSFTTQLAAGAFLYWIGYSVLGMLTSWSSFLMIMIIVTFGEVIMSPPSLTLTSSLAPEGRQGRYMGVYGFFVTVGWSAGPLYGGYFLDTFSHDPALAWGLISTLALISALGYLLFGKYLPDKHNYKDDNARTASSQSTL